MNLRERCFELLNKWQDDFGHQLNKHRKADDLEAFAREIRNDTLENVADYFEKYISLEAHEEHWVATEIRKFKETVASKATNKENE